MLDLLRADGLTPDLVSYNSALQAACAAQDIRLALDLLREVREQLVMAVTPVCACRMELCAPRPRTRSSLLHVLL
jgi:pentatricopeptide repeat protein